MPPNTTATSSHRSPVDSVPWPWRKAKVVTSAAPTTAQPQNEADGRSPLRSAANAAVDSGSKPLNTAPCEDDTLCIASVEASGQPTTMPSAARMTPGHSWRFGRRLRVSHSRDR
ncbi:hypothetical protein G6F35_018422 [Rhizopus arrhizus]|nr:hypothetical protein G6F35_018422 [Rhizopus arrhizus]